MHSFARRFARPSLERLEWRETPTAGLLDPTFGHAGVVANLGGFPIAAAVQPDGKILIDAVAPGSTANVLYRLNADGSRDRSFGANGSVSLPANGGGFPSCNPILLQPGGKIVV